MAKYKKSSSQSNKSFISIEEINQKLDKGIQDIFKSDRYKELLDVMSKFRNYSMNNNIMIMIQNPNATMVKGFRQWQELSRNVNKGEKSIKILAPMIKQKDKVDEKTKKPVLDREGKPVKEKYISGFKGVSVFDVKQTNGKEIPSARDFVNRDLKEDKNIKAFYDNFTEHINKQGQYSVREDITDKGIGGYYSPTTNEIVVSNTENKNNTEKFRVLVHEFAHAKLHNLEGEFKDADRGHKEAQAESVAYVVSSYYGVQTDDVSLGYIATWAKDPKLARQSLAEIQDVSTGMIDVLDDLQQEKIHEFYAQNTKTYEQAVEVLESKHSIDLQGTDKDNVDLQVEVLQKDSGNVLTARMEFSERTDKFQMRLNNNRIIPLDELAKEGNYALLNKELESGKVEESNYNLVKDLQVNKVEDSSKYVVMDADNNSMSQTFDSKESAEKHLNKMEISQLLHRQSFINNNKDLMNGNIEDRQNTLMLNINHRVGNYLSSDNKEFIPSDKGGTHIGWALMKRPEITSLDDLEDYRENTKHLPSNKKLFEAMDNAVVNEKENDSKVKESSKEEVELS